MKRTLKIIISLVMSFSFLLLAACSSDDIKGITSKEQLKGQKFAICTSNSYYEKLINDELGGVEFVSFTNYFDTFISVKNGACASAMAFVSSFAAVKEAYPELTYLKSDIQVPICAMFGPNSDSIKTIFNEYVKVRKEENYFTELRKRTIDNYETNNVTVDYSDLENINGTIVIAYPTVNLPFTYLKNGKECGFEAELIYDFCKYAGLKPELVSTEYDGVTAGINSGKYELAFGGYGALGERKEVCNFSEPYLTDNLAYVVNPGNALENDGIFAALKTGIYRNFIKESRWKIIADGLFTTAKISVISIVIGTLLGFIFYILFRKNNPINKLCIKINDSFEALPALIILMIFYYGFFGKSNLPGELVSILVFGMLFTFTVYTLLSSAVNTIDYGQIEGSLALGYNENQTLFKVVLPQAMKVFFPSYKSAIIGLIKGTAIVGYVAVNDLTKAGDIIRSSTFDAFIPLIAVALVYFIISKTIIKIIDKGVNKK